jgi:hypothetical protein
MEDGIQIKEKKPKRPRIKLSENKGVPVLEDLKEFKQNMCTVSAKKVSVNSGEFRAEIWMDKHYYHRHHSGENDGSERNGIDPHIIESLVIKSIPFLVQFSAIVKGFAFVNLKEYSNDTISIVLRLTKDGESLNVPIFVYHIGFNFYEITVKTAKKDVDFKIASGQYYIDFQDDGVDLFRFDNKKHNKICSL